MKFAIRSLFICCGFLITGCTQNTQYFTDSLNLALFGPESLSISQNKINELPYASIYVKQGDNPQALMILAWAEKESSQFQPNPLALKYLSANHEMIVTSAGRITKTVNLLDANLSNIRSQQPDPLAIGLHDSSTPH
ncbi:YjbF family lipoprotein, partial [Vibrio anguillarum]|nr:YjbF family lipoprotein [Vibrio anguillarum]